MSVSDRTPVIWPFFDARIYIEPSVFVGRLTLEIKIKTASVRVILAFNKLIIDGEDLQTQSTRWCRSVGVCAKGKHYKTCPKFGEPCNLGCMINMIRFSLISCPTTKVFDIQHSSSVFLRCSRTFALNVRFSQAKLGHNCSMGWLAKKPKPIEPLGFILTKVIPLVESCGRACMNWVLWLKVCIYLCI